MVDASICGLGQAAPNPLRCAIKYFPEEIKSKNFMALIANSLALSCLEKTTTAAEPIKQPCSLSVSKSGVCLAYARHS
jgi:hypothetical protein